MPVETLRTFLPLILMAVVASPSAGFAQGEPGASPGSEPPSPGEAVDVPGVDDLGPKLGEEAVEDAGGLESKGFVPKYAPSPDEDLEYAFEGEFTPISLEAAIDRAMEQNPQILSGEMSIEAAVAQRKKTAIGFFPQFTADITALVYNEKPGFGEFDMGMEGMDPSMCAAFTDTELQFFCDSLLTGFSSFADVGNSFQSEQYYVTITVGIAQPLTPLYQVYHGYKLTDLGVDVAEIELERTRQDLAMSVVEAYYGYLKARSALRSIDEAIVATEEHIKQARAFYEADIMTKNDLLQAEVRLAELYGTRYEILQGAILALESFHLILNEPVGSRLAPIDDPAAEEAFLATGLVMTEDEAMDVAFANRPELVQLDLVIAQAETNVKLQKGGYIPTVSAFVNYQHQEGSVMEQPEISFGGAFSWNLTSIASTKYAVDEAQAQIVAAQAGKENLERAVQLEVKQAMLGVQLTVKQIEIQTGAVDAAEEELRIEKKRYEQNVNTTTEVLDAQTRLVQAQVQLWTNQYDYLVALARIRKATGEL